MLNGGGIIRKQDAIVSVEKGSRDGVRRSFQSVYEVVDVDVEEDGRNGKALQNAASAEKGRRGFPIHEHLRPYAFKSQAAVMQ